MNSAGIERDQMQYDVIIVGAGPAGLACAIRLKQLKSDLSVCVLEKAAAVGAHALSGCVMEPDRSMHCCRSGAQTRPRSACRPRATSLGC